MNPIKTLRTSFFSRALFRVRVSGESMWPELVSGKTYWATGLLRPRAGDAVVFKNAKNESQVFVKRVAAVESDGYRVDSLVPWGSSSAELGIVPNGAVLGRLI